MSTATHRDVLFCVPGWLAWDSVFQATAHIRSLYAWIMQHDGHDDEVQWRFLSASPWVA